VSLNTSALASLDSSSRLRKVAVYGGAFNPPHLAHLFTVTYLLSREDVDEVWLLPASHHAFGKEMVPFEDRVALLERCLLTWERVSVCRYEYEDPQATGMTFDTLTALSERAPHVEFSLVIGADNLTDSHRWSRFDELIARWRVIAMGRPGHEEALLDASRHEWCSAGPTLPSISSTELREALYARSRLLSRGEDPESQLDPVHLERLSWLPSRCASLADRIYSAPQASNTKNIEAHPRSTPTLDVWIWGRGRVGRALGSGLREAGVRVDGCSLRALGWVGDRREETTRAQDIESPIDQTLEERALASALGAPTWIIGARDSQLYQVSSALRDALLQSPHLCASASTVNVLHCAGSQGISALDPLLGVIGMNFHLGKCHPLKALRGDERLSDFTGTAFLVESAPMDEVALTAGVLIAEHLRGWVLPPPPALNSPALNSPVLNSKNISPEEVYALYHCAAVFASNLPLALLNIGVSLFQTLGWSEEEATQALAPLARYSIAPQSTEITHPIHAHLTGPIARGDLDSVEAHIRALGRHAPHLKRIYKDLSTYAIQWIKDAEAARTLNERTHRPDAPQDTE
jgi:nicotinate-nucleotide adenylyltransferase